MEKTPNASYSGRPYCQMGNWQLEHGLSLGMETRPTPRDAPAAVGSEMFDILVGDSRATQMRLSDGVEPESVLGMTFKSCVRDMSDYMSKHRYAAKRL